MTAPEWHDAENKDCRINWFGPTKKVAPVYADRCTCPKPDELDEIRITNILAECRVKRQMYPDTYVPDVTNVDAWSAFQKINSLALAYEQQQATITTLKQQLELAKVAKDLSYKAVGDAQEEAHEANVRASAIETHNTEVGIERDQALAWNREYATENKELKARVAELEAGIEAAAHEDDCTTMLRRATHRLNADRTDFPCNCWKAELLGDGDKSP